MASTVTPTSVQLKAAKTQVFTVSVSWSIDPASLGTIDGTGLYKAPEIIGQKQEVNAVAKDTDGKVIGRAAITLLPPVAAPVAPSAGVTAPPVAAPVAPSAGVTAPPVAAPVAPSAGTTAMIHPSSVTLRAGQTQEFRVSVTWALEPATAPGKIDEVTGEYSAPCEVLVSKIFCVVARNARKEELGRSTVTVAPPDPPMRTLTVTPETAVLQEGQQLALSVEPKDQAVKWQIPVRGAVDSAGVYTAPEKIVSQQTVILTAMSPDGAHYGKVNGDSFSGFIVCPKVGRLLATSNHWAPCIHCLLVAEVVDAVSRHLGFGQSSHGNTKFGIKTAVYHRGDWRRGRIKESSVLDRKRWRRF